MRKEIVECSNQSNLIQPFLRWAGGKGRLIKEIEKHIPQTFDNYFELFLGGASLFTHLVNANKIKNKVFLSDINNDLINVYIQIRDDIEGVITFLSTYKNNETFYYKLREKKSISQIENAARFIFLNRTSFNGIYRENLKGKYNVPYGFKKYRELFDYNNLREFSRKLKNVTLRAADFEESIDQINTNDFVFLDPPYTVAHSNNGFIKYNQKLFSINDQQRLANFINRISKKGTYFILTNACHKNIKKIFVDLNYKTVERYSVIGGKNAERKLVEEYIFFK
ncbi:MAG: Dam family site-specific DNA-(adenine-N6)-methyltransferase [Ignavibacteria bacterium]|nr:Dam family site-specific DNA-(adenine-N6)-methyltransferase [Ignavibacteria bacterium]